jgi:hypothetical protein
MSACTVPRTVLSVRARIVQKHREDGGRRAVDGHRHRGLRRAQVEALVQHLHIVEGGDRHAGVADLAVDVRPLVRVKTIQRHRIKSGRQPLRCHALGQAVKAPVGAQRVTLAREHTRRVLVLALEGKYARGKREGAGHVLKHQPAQNFTMILEARQRHLWDAGARERNMDQ